MTGLFVSLGLKYLGLILGSYVVLYVIAMVLKKIFNAEKSLSGSFVAVIIYIAIYFFLSSKGLVLI